MTGETYLWYMKLSCAAIKEGIHTKFGIAASVGE